MHEWCNDFPRRIHLGPTGANKHLASGYICDTLFITSSSFPFDENSVHANTKKGEESNPALVYLVYPVYPISYSF